MARVEKWLAPFSWEMIVSLNEGLCAQKEAFHGPTSDGFEVTKNLWAQQHLKEMTLAEAVGLLRDCHRMAPFCFYNGNTFASVALLIIRKLDLEPEKSFVVRSLAGHIVAGVSTGEEENAFQHFSDQL